MKKTIILLFALPCILLSSCSNDEEDYSNEKAQLVVSTEGTSYQDTPTDGEGKFVIHLDLSASDITGVETSTVNVNNITVNSVDWWFYSPDFKYADPVYTSLALDGKTYCDIIWGVDEDNKTFPFDAEETLRQFVKEMTQIILQKGTVRLSIYGEAPNPSQWNSTLNVKLSNDLEFRIKK